MSWTSPFDGGEHDLAGGVRPSLVTPVARLAPFSSSMNGIQISDRLLHHARRFHQPAAGTFFLAEEVPTIFMPAISGAFDHVQRPSTSAARLRCPLR